MKKNLLLAAILLCCQSIYAYEGEDDDYSHDFEKDGILYDITSEIELTVEVNRSFSDEHQYRGDIVIPKEVEHNTKIYTVTGIDDEAFYGCHELTSIKLPNTIKYIGGSAFLRCNKLSNIDIPHSVVEIGRAAFSRCGSLASVTLGGSIVDIEEDVFSFCKKLKYIKIPNSVKNIGTQAFYGCSNLKNIDFGENTNNIGSEAFGATEWYNVQPEGIVYAGKVVYDYKGTMPENTSINLIDGTLGIATGVFSYTKLSDIKIPNTVITIGESAFYGCSEITKIEIPNSVIKIGKYAFYNCDGLKDVSLGNSLVNIDNEAFYDCDRLDSIDIPHSVIRIGSEAFMSCGSLVSVTIGKSVSEIEFCAFKLCENLKLVINYSDLNLVGNSERHGYVAYYAKKIINADDRVDDFFFQITDSVVYLSDYIGNEKELSLPQHYNNGSYSIGAFAFSGDSLTSVFISDKVKSIGNGAFSHCLSLTNVTIGDSVSKIGEDAFFRCISLPNIKIPNNVVEIGHGAFGRCTELKKVVIGESVRLIGSRAFNQCSNLTDISLGKDVVYIGYNAFADCRSLTNIYISDIRAWCNIDYYSQFEQPMRWANHLYLNGKEVKDLTLPNGIQDIKDYAFYGCDSLKSINIPNSIASIGNMAFKGCISLKSVNIPNTVTSIGNETFYGCTSLKSINIPNSITSIGDRAFCNCRGLKRVTLGKSIMNIGKTAFEPYYLDSMVVRSEFPPRIKDGAFLKNSIVNGENVYMSTLYVPRGCEDMYKNADVWCEFEKITPCGTVIKVEITDYNSLLRGAVLELSNIKSDEKNVISVTNQPIYTFGGIEEDETYNLYLKNMMGDILGRIENIRPNFPETFVNLSISKRPQDVKVFVMLPHGLDVTDNVSISWYNEKNQYLSQGNRLSGVLEGHKVYYKIKLPKVLVEQYQTPSTVSYEVKDSVNNIVCTLQPFNRIKISGYVKEEGTNSPLSGVNVNIEQSIGNGIKKTTTSVSDQNGWFSAEIYNTDAQVLVSSPSYLSQYFNIKPDKETLLDDIVLEPMDGSVIVLDYSFKESVEDEQESEIVNWYYDEKNVVYTIFNKSKGAEVKNFYVQNSGIVLQEKVEENDVLLITAKSKTQKFRDITVECVMNALGQVKVTVPVVEFGVLNAYCTEDIEGQAVGLLYDGEGTFVRKEKYNADTLAIKDIPDGQYTLVSMGNSDFFNTLPNLHEYDNMGITENVDYVKNSVSIESGRVSSILVKPIPAFNEAKFYYTTNASGIVANKPSVTAGEYLVLKTNVDFKSEYADKINGLKLRVHLPDGCELYPNTVIVNSKMTGYTTTENYVEIDLDEIKNDIRLCIIPNKPGVIEPSGSLQFNINGNNVTQPIGAAYFVCKAFDLSVPGLTNDSIITVRGAANRKGADIYIYDNTKLVGQTTSLADGNWQTDIKLYKPYTRTYHKIHAEIVDAGGNKLPTETKTVEFDKNLQQVLEKIVMYYQGQEIIFNNSEGTNSDNSYSYVPDPDDCEFTFTAHFSKNDANTISNLEFKVLASDGSTRTIPGRYNESQDVWIGVSRYPDSKKIPVNVTISYDKVEYASPIFDDEMEKDFEEITESILNEIDKAYSNGFIEIIEDKDSCLYFSLITKDYNTKEFFKFSVLDYEETVYTHEGLNTVTVKNDTLDLCSVYEYSDNSVNLIVWDNKERSAYKIVHSGQCPMGNSGKKRIVPFLIGATASVAMSAFEYNTFVQEVDGWYEYVNVEKEEFRKRHKKISEALYATCDDGILKIKDEDKLIMCTNMANEWIKSTKKYLKDFDTFIDGDKKALQTKCVVKGLIGCFVKIKLVNTPTISTGLGKGAEKLLENLVSVKPALINGTCTQVASYVLGEDVEKIESLLTTFGIRKTISEWSRENSKTNTDGYVKLMQTIKSSYSSCEKEEEKEEEGEKDNPKNNTDKESKNDRFDESVEYRNPNLQPAIDPSGYVYESVPSNRLQGVTATIFYQEKEEDIYGNITDKAVLWNAEEFSQKNPLVTDAEGKYQWDVPQGLWQVRFEKEGYETAYSDWLPVPPPQLEVNIAMMQNTQPVVKTAHAYVDGVEFEFDKYMLPELLNIYTVQVSQNGETVNGAIEFVNKEATNTGETYVSKVKFVPERHFTAEKVELFIRNVAQSYAGIAMAEDYLETLDVEYRITGIEADTIINMYCDSVETLTVSVIPAKAAEGKTLHVISTSPQIAYIADEYYKIDKEGKAYVQLKGILPGSASLKYTVDGYDISAQTDIKVRMYTDSFCDVPFASIKSGSEVERGSEVRLYCNTEGATIYYTLDGSCPCNDTPSRNVYDGNPIIINESVVIKAMATAPNLYESHIAEFEYIVINSSSIDFTDADDVHISPLPLKDKLNIELDGKVIKTVSLLTLKGETITRMHPQSEKTSMNVGHLSPGVYILHIVAIDKVYSLKLVKQDR